MCMLVDKITQQKKIRSLCLYPSVTMRRIVRKIRDYSRIYFIDLRSKHIALLELFKHDCLTIILAIPISVVQHQTYASRREKYYYLITNLGHSMVL
jgi:hypothetical protein